MKRWIAILFLTSAAAAQPSEKLQVTLQRIFNSNQFAGRGGRGGGAARWMENGAAYATVEQGQIVRYDTATGARSVLVSSEQPISDYAWSPDGSKVLAQSNPHRVLIRKTAGEYRVLDRKGGAPRKLGGDKGSDLLFAKFSPDGSRVAYVRDTNVFVEDLATGTIRQLTSDGTDMILNGVSDWVYDEEFRTNDCFRWSPDGQSIAYWQFDQHDVPVYSLVNYTDGLYPTIFRYPYPKAGQTNSAVRVGVVSAKGGPTRWIKAPGDPRNIYIPRMEWTPR